ncbi:hypothetical protein NDU88_000829 [Pleurodeles waltl]|uniref:Uncharacterized protein n=1 Tax=Pleurodeles waltl TaxID=8319 RepID=A0AAV7Q489_PLEWA|nr:hypothetical protein NDU88_000829 [Pleurodeles waltl]
MSGPLTKILDLAIESKETETPLDTEAILQWAQRAICLLGNANCAMSTERRRSFLIRLDPKLPELATNEAGSSANGMLFGDKFIANLRKYVATFTALDKAQSNIKKVLNNALFIRAGRFRGRTPGRRFQTPRYATQGNRGNYPNQGNFYPNRYRGRGHPEAGSARRQVNTLAGRAEWGTGRPRAAVPLRLLQSREAPWTSAARVVFPFGSKLPVSTTLAFEKSPCPVPRLPRSVAANQTPSRAARLVSVPKRPLISGQ